jgi:hypothetical protein
MVTAVESDGSRSRLYPVPGEASTWRVYRDNRALGRVVRVGAWYVAKSQDGRTEQGGFRTRREASAYLQGLAGVVE